MAIGKRIKKQREKVEITKEYAPLEACKTVAATASAKFDETVDVAINLGVDAKKADQNVKGSVALPHGLGKNIRVVVFAKGEKAREAEEAGADLVGAEDLAQKIQQGFLDFDTLIATPDMMGQIGKIGKILGPRGLMPSPKLGTVTMDIASVVKSSKAGRAEFKVDKEGIVHAALGKASFGGEKLHDNFAALMQALIKIKPSTSKGTYLKRCTMSLTMGPAVKIDLTEYRSA
jgi:large subunit ribosomal protein L1